MEKGEGGRERKGRNDSTKRNSKDIAVDSRFMTAATGQHRRKGGRRWKREKGGRGWGEKKEERLK
jgi:hypothetical protein